ncbi:MAG: acetate--CoA ligase family protein [Gemmatimonadota bacterium]|nr:acetate--CoA ligase family protein [Gemmatimonadota bacterium]
MPGPDPASQGAARLIERALSVERTTLLEPEGYELLASLGVTTPEWIHVPDAPALAHTDLTAFGARLVVKLVSEAVTHKTDVGGVAVVENEPRIVRQTAEAMAARVAGLPVDGFLLSTYVAHDTGFGSELLLGLRQTDDFGPVVTVGSGGVRAELLAQSLRPGQDVALFTTDTGTDAIADRLLALPVTRISCGAARGARRMVPVATLVDLVQRLLAFAETPAGAHVAELEVNPLVLAADGPTALDVLVRLRVDVPPPMLPRPLAKLGRLFQPESMAIVGVSEGVNAGRLILRNVLHAGFPADRVVVIKPGTEHVDGVRCVPSLAALGEPVDLCVLAVAAPRIPELVEEIVRSHRAESVIVIPGGLGEREGSGTLEDRVRAAIAAGRATTWGGPIVNGGNCLGIRSVPGGYDTTFIPPYKLGTPSNATAPVALLAQSGAFAVARWSKLAAAPRYLVSVGNQADLTLGDYLTYLADDTDVAVYACYVEGFRPGDGVRWLRAARAIVDAGRTVILYRAARTAAGCEAGRSHTAAIAGDYVVTRELATAAGVLVAETLDEFDDLLRVATMLADRRPRGPRVGAVSNAGFECVAFGDSVGALAYPALGAATNAGLRELLARQRLDGVVDVRHPLDVTPMMDDAALADAVGLLLADDAVDIGVVGLVPLTGALQTLPAGADHREQFDGSGAIAARLVRLRMTQDKPFVVVVDAGAAYDPLAAFLDRAGIPTFRTMDRALRILDRLVRRTAGVNTRAQAPVLTGAAT